MPRNAIDASTNCAAAAACFRSNGIEVALRYYSERHRAKAMKRPEALALARAGLKIGVVYQDTQNAASFFSFSLGLRAGAFAYDYAVKEIRQPPGSAIYFAVDFDALAAELKNNVIPYFEGVKQAFDTAGGGRPDYAVGAYGSGATLTALTTAKLATRFWLCARPASATSGRISIPRSGTSANSRRKKGSAGSTSTSTTSTPTFPTTARSSSTPRPTTASRRRAASRCA